MRIKCLSLTCPWPDSIIYGGKPVENRLAWKGSSFRGQLLLHAAKGMKISDYNFVVRFVEERYIAWKPRPIEQLVRGAIVCVVNVVDVIMPGGLVHGGEGYPPSRAGTERHRLADNPYYMGGFALVLEDVRPLRTPIPYKGAQGLFWVPTSTLGDQIDLIAPTAS